MYVVQYPFLSPHTAISAHQTNIYGICGPTFCPKDSSNCPVDPRLPNGVTRALLQRKKRLGDGEETWRMGSEHINTKNLRIGVDIDMIRHDMTWYDLIWHDMTCVQFGDVWRILGEDFIRRGGKSTWQKCHESSMFSAACGNIIYAWTWKITWQSWKCRFFKAR